MTRSSKRRVVFAGVALSAVLVVGRLSLPAWGTGLIVEDALQPARAIVVLGGRVPFRAMEAANLYKQGWAHEIWLTQGGVFAQEVALHQLGLAAVPEHEYSRMVLDRLGVPADAIRLLPERNRNTVEEVRAIAGALKTVSGDRIILVTSSYHTRRVKVLWRALAGKGAGAPLAIIRHAADEPFAAATWWRDSTDAAAVVHEWFGLLNAWAGFPIKSEHG